MGAEQSSSVAAYTAVSRDTSASSSSPSSHTVTLPRVRRPLLSSTSTAAAPATSISPSLHFSRPLLIHLAQSESQSSSVRSLGICARQAHIAKRAARTELLAGRAAQAVARAGIASEQYRAQLAQVPLMLEECERLRTQLESLRSCCASLSDLLLSTPAAPQEDDFHVAQCQALSKLLVSTDESRMGRQLLTRWLNDFLLEWPRMRGIVRVRKAWRQQGLPRAARRIIWRLEIGNQLLITESDFSVACDAAREARHLSKSHSALLKRQYELAVAGADPRQFSSNSTSTSDEAKFIRLVDVDVPRTLSSSGLFRQSDDLITSHLNQVLSAYACFERGIGYSQGMSSLAALLLLFLDSPAIVFVALANLAARPLLSQLFQCNLNALHARCDLFDRYLLQRLPRLARHFSQLGVQTEHFLLEWLICLFSKSLPFELAAHVFDVYLLEGESFLFRVAMALLLVFEQRLLRFHMDEVLSLLRRPHGFDSMLLFDAIDACSLPDFLPPVLNEINQLE